MSPRAAWRLEALGFNEVYDYEGGKMDWMAFWLPWEGSARAEPRLGDLVHRDAPRCSPADRLTDVSARMAAGWSWCAVVNEPGILLGRLRRLQIDQHPEARAEDMMESGPSTYRPDITAQELLGRMKAGRFESAFVSDPDGRLWGLVSRADVEVALGEARP